MKLFLWVFISIGVINTASALWVGITGNVAPVSLVTRALDALTIAVLTGWAIALLARGA